MGGPVFGLKKAIDDRLVPGPRIYPSGTLISQTGGHMDFSVPPDAKARRFGGQASFIEKFGVGQVVDGPDEMLTAVRVNLRQGASQIKLAASGSGSGLYDPITVTEFTPAEIRAAVDAAADWGTYVTVHVYTDKGIQRSVEAGVKVIEHGQLITEPVMKLLADKGVRLSTQPFLFPGTSNPNRKAMSEGTAKMYALAKKYNMKLTFGTDLHLGPAEYEQPEHEVAMLASLSTWFSPFEALKQATGNATELLQMSGPRNPYPGKIGVIEEGAYADMLLVDGNPLEDLNLVADPWKNYVLIIKDGVIHKNLLDRK